jgi:hypothetical protein
VVLNGLARTLIVLPEARPAARCRRHAPPRANVTAPLGSRSERVGPRRIDDSCHRRRPPAPDPGEGEAGIVFEPHHRDDRRTSTPSHLNGRTPFHAFLAVVRDGRRHPLG